MITWTSPSSISELHGFLGLTGFYLRFIKGYASIASSLTALLHTDNFDWNSEAQAAFTRLKHVMTQALILALPDSTITFILKTDTSGLAMGVALLQRSHSIAFHSKVFCARL